MAQRLITGSLVLGLLMVIVCMMVPTGSATPSQPASHVSSSSEVPAVSLEVVKSVRESAQTLLKPLEDLHDGNVCDINEELFGGLCYKTCSILTHAQAPIRTSAFTCCESHPCGLSNQRGGVLGHVVCSGFDVSGQDGCPHKPGTCLLDEEMHLGMCYKKCDLLTDGQYSNRIAAATCCKAKGLSCLNPMNVKTRKAFDVGGGDDHDASTPSEAHPPLKSLTEDEAFASEAAAATNPRPQAPSGPSHLPMQHHPGGGSNDTTCGDGEELHDGLCYRSCALLTNGEAPIRTSSWTCCEAHPCTLFNQRGAVGTTILCNGFDISGNGGCPHKPGVCFDEEEEHLGVCYERCAILTNGQYPYRSAAATCCKKKGLGCFLPSNIRTSDAFAVGSSKASVAPPAAHHAEEEAVGEVPDAVEEEDPKKTHSAQSGPSSKQWTPLGDAAEDVVEVVPGSMPEVSRV